MTSFPNNNETIHISLGKTANFISSHLLNLQGLAATSATSDNNGDANDNNTNSLCDPSVTHDISSLDSDYYSTYSSSSSSSRYVYVPRALFVDGRDSFGVSWGGVSSNSFGASRAAVNVNQGINNDSFLNGHSRSVVAWNGQVSVLNACNFSLNGEGQQHEKLPPEQQQQQQQLQQQQQILNQHQQWQVENDPLQKFQTAASYLNLSPQYSRFNASTPFHAYSSSYNANSNCDPDENDYYKREDEEEEDDDEYDDYCYGQSKEQLQREKQRQLERMQQRNKEIGRNWNEVMEEAWEEAYYGGTSCATVESTGAYDSNHSAPMSANSPSNTPNQNSTSTQEREIKWYDFWMPPHPPTNRYQVPLPFDTANSGTDAQGNNDWSSSFYMGHSPESNGSSSKSIGISKSWQEHNLFESVRQILEGCDVVKGFNIFVDGGQSVARPSGGGDSRGGRRSKASEKYEVSGGGGFYAGIATSLMEELHEECRSAGRWAALTDPFPFGGGANNHAVGGSEDVVTESDLVNEFRTRLNAGLSLHGLSTNADVFLPLSIDGGYRALRGMAHNNGTMGSTECAESASPNRILFEGSAAVALALETSTLSYRLHRHGLPTSNSKNISPRSRIGIQSGFYQGSSNSSMENNEPFSTASSLTYHEFLKCARPSSDRRRSILELDALLHPLSYNFTSTDAASGSLLGAGGGLSPAALMTLSSLNVNSGSLAGILGGTNDGYLGELHKKLMMGTSLEEMKMEQERHRVSSHSRYRGGSSRTSGHKSCPGEWLEESASGGAGVLCSLSGNHIPFGKRSNHHHFSLSASLRPPASDRSSTGGAVGHGGYDSSGATSSYLRPMMESLGVKYRPEVSVAVTVQDSVVDLTGVGSYWRTVFSGRKRIQSLSQENASSSNAAPSSQKQQPGPQPTPKQIASHSPILSVLGNSTRSYPRLSTTSSGFLRSLHSRTNMGYYSRDVLAGLIPEKDDCEEALEYCRELVDVYEPPSGSGLLALMGEDENDDVGAYFDEG